MLEAIFTVQVFHMLNLSEENSGNCIWNLPLPQNLLKSNDSNWPNLTGTGSIWLEKTRPCIQGYTLSNLGVLFTERNGEDQRIQQGWFTGSIQLIKHLRAVEDTFLNAFKAVPHSDLNQTPKTKRGSKASAKLFFGCAIVLYYFLLFMEDDVVFIFFSCLFHNMISLDWSFNMTTIQFVITMILFFSNS